MAESYLDMIFRTKKEGAANKQVADELKDLKTQGKSASEAFEMLTGSSLSAAGAFGVVAGALKYSISAAMESEKIQADLNATLTSTKQAAGLSADEINRMASSLSEMSGIEDDSIVKAQAMLLTFTNIGRDVFPMASEAMVNMASKFGSVDAAAMQLGKALNDPIAGVGALRRVGVALSEVQEEQIRDFMELGDVASAQKVILGELQTEFGGLAAAMGNTTEGSIKKLQNSLGNLAEAVGGKLTPYLKEAADALTILVQWNDKTERAFKDHSDEVARTTLTYEDYRDEMLAAKIRTGEISEEQRDLLLAMYDTQESIDAQFKSWGFLTKAETEQVQVSARMKEALDGTRGAALAAAGSVDEFSSKVGSSSLVTSEFGKILKDLEKDKLTRLTAEMQSYKQQLLFNQAAAGLDADASRKLAEAMGLIDGATSAALTELDALKLAFDDGRKNTEVFAQRVQSLNNAILALKDKNITITTRMVTLYESYDADEEGRYKEVPFTPTPEPKWTPYPGESGLQSESPMGRQGAMINLGGVTINNAMDLDVLVARLARMTR